MKYRDIFFIFLGIFFIFFGILAIVNSILNEIYFGIFWACYSSMIIIGIGILIGSSFLVASQLNILMIPLILWNIDFLYYIFKRENLFGLVEYYFKGTFGLSKIIGLEHLFIIPLCLVYIFLKGLRRKDFWKISLIQLFLIFFISRIFTKPNDNINCVFQSCFPFVGNFLFSLVWIFLGFSIIVITNIFLSQIFIRKV